MNYDSYAEGFCKTAAGFGIDPKALIASARSAGASALSQAKATTGQSSEKVKQLVALLKGKIDGGTVKDLVGGGLLGGSAGYLLTDPAASQKKKLRNTLLGVGTGAAARVGLSQALKQSPEQIAARKEAIRKMIEGLRKPKALAATTPAAK